MLVSPLEFVLAFDDLLFGSLGLEILSVFCLDCYEFMEGFSGCDNGVHDVLELWPLVRGDWTLENFGEFELAHYY